MNKQPVTTLRILINIFSISVLGSCALAIIILYFLLRPQQSPMDATQFNTNRQTALDTTPITQIIPKQVGDFALQEFTNNETNQNIQQNIFAIYKNNYYQAVHLTAQLSINTPDYRPFLSLGTMCGECGGKVKLYTKAPTSYGYAFCACMGFAQHTLAWINGHWLLGISSASTLQGDGNTLLNFANNYPY